MDDEDLKAKIVNTPEKKAVESQLDSFINPQKKNGAPILNPISFSDTLPPIAPIRPAMKLNIPDIPENAPVVAAPVSNEIHKPIVRTYKSDVEETIQTGHVSSINIALAENKKMMGQMKNEELFEKKNKLNKNILIISLVLLVGGGAVFLVPYLLVQNQYGPKKAPVETVSSKSIITVDTEEKINTKDLNLARVASTLKERVDQSSTKLGQIKNIYLTEGDGVNEKLITSDKFMSLIGSNMPSEVQRTLKPQYMFGMYNFNGNQRFLILKVGSYDTTFSGMLKWETNLWSDFKELFELKSSTDTTGSSSFGLEIKKFQDATFDNKDCRVIKDDSGNIIFLYSIIDENTIVITTSTDTLKEIINRVGKARVTTQ